MKKIKLKKGKEESLLRRHPWVFSGAIATIDEGIEEGETVAVYTAKDALLAVGHYQIGSIAVRVLQFYNPEKKQGFALNHDSGKHKPTTQIGDGNADFSHTDDSLSQDFYYRRLEAALKMREALNLIRPDNNCYRLIHGEGDFLPGLVVDIYGDTAVVQAHSPGMHFERFKIAESLVSLPEAGIRNVYYKSDTTLPFKAHLDPVNDYLIGKYDGCMALENGLNFNIDWLKGQKTGFFIDQRENRALLEKLSKGREVLNMFCYTGGFSVYAIRGDAKRVVSVDSSSKAIELTEANVRINFPESKNHTAVAEDAFKFLDTIDKDEYDLIVLDPPAFAKHRSAIKNGLIGYRKLNLKAFEKIRKGGIIFTFSCSQAITKEMFRLAVFTAAAQSGRKVRILHQLTQPADHPIDISHPEGEYLKGLVLYVE